MADEQVSRTQDSGGGFVWRTQIHFDDLDPMGMLHNSRYLVLIERAEAAFNWSQGRRWELDLRDNPDQFYAVREQAIRYVLPVRGCLVVDVEMRLVRLGTSSATWSFEVRTPAGLHATASRTIVKLDPSTYRPAPWTPGIRESFATIATAGQRPVDEVS